MRFGHVFQVAIAASVMVLTPGAAAANFGPYYAEGSHHTFVDESLNYYWGVAADRAEVILGDTAMSAAWVTYHAADIALYSQNEGDAGYYGYYQCVTELSSEICSHAHIVFNTFYETTTQIRKSTACHEVGHSVGLKHKNDYDGCMHSDEEFPIDYGDPHDLNHLSSKY